MELIVGVAGHLFVLSLLLVFIIWLEASFTARVITPLRFVMLNIWGHAPITIEVCRHIKGC